MKSILPTDVRICPFEIEHYDAAVVLWERSKQIGLSSADGREAIKVFLLRNRGLSKVAISNTGLVGAVLCGHDGRRGYLYHLCVEEGLRLRGLGRELVNACLDGLKNEGIQKCHVFIFNDNESGMGFWARVSWRKRDDIAVFSRDIGTNPAGSRNGNHTHGNAGEPN
ncbi:MAG: hypothetical protein A2Y72_03400 [Chloroflexi bacterium RBG_13_53_26]|nr:MAG: hypothetical protein A2Y72_03400 [Chloroflexi bacterium RBG_13_53_26]